MSRILVTGGAGYIGSILVPELLRSDHHVTVVDNFMYGQASLLEHCWDPRLEVVRGDVRDEELIKKHLAGVDAIIPLAAIVGMPACDKRPIDARTINLDAVKLLLEARKHQVVLFPTTESGYGKDGLVCTEETPLKPISLYGRLKVEAERAVLDAGNCVTLRLGTVFGMSPRMRFDLLVNDFVYRALTDRSLALFEPHFKRNYVHIRDVARVFTFALANHDAMNGQAYNVGLETSYSKEELCDEIKRVIPNFWYPLYTGTDKMEDPDRRNYIVSHQKLMRLGFACRTTLREGIMEIVKGVQVLQRNQFSNV